MPDKEIDELYLEAASLGMVSDDSASDSSDSTENELEVEEQRRIDEFIDQEIFEAEEERRINELIDIEIEEAELEKQRKINELIDQEIAEAEEEQNSDNDSDDDF